MRMYHRDEVYDLIQKFIDTAQRGIIIEFKRLDGAEQTPESAGENALKQIEAGQYAVELESAGVREILKLAVVFQGKRLWVKQG